MSVYSFGKQSLIREVSVQRSEGGGRRAYIYAREDAKSSELNAIKNLLTANDMQWSPIQTGGGAALEIRGLGKDDNHLLRLLSVNNAIAGGYKKQPSVGDVMTFWDKLRKNTLRASGVAYFVGDAGFFAYEWKQSFNKEGKLTNLPGLLAGVCYALGTPVITFFGRGDKSDFQLKHISYNTIRELEKQGIKVPDDSAIKAVADGHNEGMSQKIYNFFERFPAEITNSTFGVAGAMMIWAGIKDHKEYKKLGTVDKSKRATILIDIGIGVMTVLAGLISVFVEEEAPDPDAPKKKGLARVWQYIKEKPLRAAGAALMVSTVGHTASTVIGWKSAKVILADNKINPHHYTANKAMADKLESAQNLKSALPGRAVFAVTNLTAEGLMAVSSKGHGASVKSDTSLDRSVYAVMADLVLHSPQIDKDLLLGKISEFLADKKHLGGHPAYIENGIRDQLKAMSKNPWAGVVIIPTIVAPPAKTEDLSKILASADITKPSKVNWRERTMAPQSPEAALTPAMI